MTQPDATNGEQPSPYSFAAMCEAAIGLNPMWSRANAEALLGLAEVGRKSLLAVSETATPLKLSYPVRQTEDHPDCLQQGNGRYLCEAGSVTLAEWLMHDLNAKGAAPSAIATSEREDWLIWSNEHRSWWGRNHCGYVWEIENAGRYTLSEATKICKSRSWGDRTPPETMIHIDSIPGERK